MTKKTKRKPNKAFMKPLPISPSLQAVIGKGPLNRGQMMKKIWAYIKKHDLQDAKNRRKINLDAKLKQLFKGKRSVTMFELTALLSKHIGDKFAGKGKKVKNNPSHGYDYDDEDDYDFASNPDYDDDYEDEDEDEYDDDDDDIEYDDDDEDEEEYDDDDEDEEEYD